jgi:SNF2 family DNA or RNA helicase
MRYKFKFKPYEHQLEALKKSWDKPYFALFMDMGTGKSKVLIDTLAMLYDKGEVDSALIIAPKGVYRNWERKELPTHLPDHIKANIVTWSPEQTQKKKKELDTLQTVSDDLQIFLMNVEALSTKRGYEVADKFLFTHRAMLAVDESTTIKSKGAQRTKNLIKLGKQAAYRRILTGSPVTKSPLDLFTQCEFLDHHVLGHASFWTFQNRYAKMVRRTMGAHSFNQIVGYQNLGELNDIIEPFSFRVRKEDCLDLPDKVYTRRNVELTPEQRKLYEQMRRNALAIIEGEGLISAPTVLTQILRLQQVCSGFAKLEDGRMVQVPSNKLSELMSALEEVDGKVIIWGNFTHDLHIIRDALKKEYGEQSVELFYGNTPGEERQLIVERFQDPNHPLRFFVGQPRTGGYGLTLTEAHTVIYYSNGYDLEVRLQSEDRAHRIGQTNKVTYIDIVAEGTVDEKVLRALRDKIDISTRVLAEGHKEWII